MNYSGNPTSIERNVTLTTEKILSKSEKLGTNEERITYLKKVISDCQRIINLAEKIDGKYLDVNYLLKSEQNIDENLIMFLDKLCELPAPLPNTDLTTDKARKQGKVPWVVKQPRKYYKVTLSDGDKVCDIQIAFGGIKSFTERIEDQITVIEAAGNNEEMKAINPGDTIKIETGISVIVRIFESMKGARIIWSETPIKDIAGIFFSDAVSKIKFEKNYNSAKSRIEKEESSTNNEKLLGFILLLIEKSFKGKEKELEKIIKQTEELQKNSI